jgi:hypothetical protein
MYASLLISYWGYHNTNAGVISFPTCSFPLREISNPELADEVLTFTCYSKFEMDFEMHSWRATYHDEFQHKKQRKKWLKSLFVRISPICMRKLTCMANSL